VLSTGLQAVACSPRNTVTTTMPSIIQMLMHWSIRMVMIWYFDNKSPISIRIFRHLSQMDNCWAWMMFVFIFLWLDVFKLLDTSSIITFDCDIFLSYGIFGCHCMAILFCMIIAVSKQLLCSIKFCWRRWCFQAIFVMYLSKPGIIYLSKPASYI